MDVSTEKKGVKYYLFHSQEGSSLLRSTVRLPEKRNRLIKRGYRQKRRDDLVKVILSMYYMKILEF